MTPLVSIAIITYNQINYLQECIASAISQDYPNKEIIVADDGSTDGTPEILRKYENNFPSLFKIVYSKTNQGVTRNSNSALRICEGKYIALIAGDDLMLPQKLTKQVDFLENHPEHSLCFHNMLYMTNKVTDMNYCSHSLIKQTQYPLEKLIEHNFIPASSIVVRHSCVPENGFNDRLPLVSDWLFSIETAAKGKIGFINEILGYYRLHDENISSNLERCMPDILETLNIVDEKFPAFNKITEKARSKFYFNIALEKIITGENANGRSLLKKSLRYDWKNWKPIAGYLLSLLGRKTVRKIYNFKKIKRVKAN